MRTSPDRGDANVGAWAALLTPRQRQILSLVGRGMTARQIARQLGISPKTVEQHKAKIFAKLGVPNQAAAVGRIATGAFGGDRSTEA